MKQIELATLPTEVLDAVLSYLGNRPWTEVQNLIQAVHQNTQVHTQEIVEESDLEEASAEESFDVAPGDE